MEHTIPHWQLQLRQRCYHPSGEFHSFPPEDRTISIPSRFSKIAALYPERTALRSLTASYSYRTLHERSNQIACYLLRYYNNADRPVALVFDHDAEIIIAMLAVLKAGLYYVAIDTDEPSYRTLSFLRAFSIELLLTNSKENDKSALLDALPVNISVLDTFAIKNSEPNSCSLPDIGPKHPAQLVCTSGSTGIQKSVIHTHQNILHDTYQYTNAAHYCQYDRFLLVSACSFSDSIRTIYGALLNGGTLLPHSVKDYGLVGLDSWIHDQKITIYRSVPTLFRCFMALPKINEYPSVRLVILSGEAVYKSDFIAFKKAFNDDCLLLNRLGSSECLTYAMFFMDKHTSFDGNVVPVGYVTPGKDIFVYDIEGTHSMERGPGQIAVKSRYLSSGYVSLPELSRNSFPPEFRTGDEILYLTGDLGRFSEDNCLHHLGRLDFQVKVHGKRVELTEIESILSAHPKIAQAAVIYNSTEPSGLSAYLVANDCANISLSSIRKYLRERLPLHMLPKYMTFVDQLPTTRTGKIDRKQLPQISPAQPRANVKPSIIQNNSIETNLRTIWATLLKLPTVEKMDGFIDLGGDSITALQIVTRIFEHYKINIPSRMLLKNANVAEVARAINNLLANKLAG